MTGGESFQKANAARQRHDVRERLERVLKDIRDEIVRNVEEGRPKYPRRLTQGEILRRADGIDKNTLKQPYHADLRQAVAALISEAAGPSEELAKSAPPKIQGVEAYAQMLVAAQIRRDAAEVRAREAEASVAQLERQIAALKGELNLLRMSGGNVVQFAARPGGPSTDV